MILSVLAVLACVEIEFVCFQNSKKAHVDIIKHTDGLHRHPRANRQ